MPDALGMRTARRFLGVCALAAAWAAAARGAETWSLERWLQAHPEQREIADAFARRVAEPARPAARAETAAPVRIAAVVPALQESDFWRRNVAALEARLAEAGLSCSVERHFSRPDEADRRSRQLREALAADPDYLVFTFDSPGDLALADHLLARGRPRLLVLNSTTPQRDFGARQPLLYAGFDHEEGSRTLAEHFAAAYPDGADWMLLLFAEGQVSRQRGGAFVRELARRPGMRLLDVHATDGSRARARVAAADALARHPGLRLICAVSTDVALGAVDALRESGRADVAVNGWGGGGAELAAVAAGELVITPKGGG